MSTFERGDLTTATAAASPAFEIRAAASEAMYIKELGLFLTAATATTLGLGRPANTPAGGTVGLGSGDLDPDDVPSVGGVVLSGQTTAPTAPTLYKRQIVFPGAIGNGIVWSWPEPGLRIKQGTSLVLWNIALNSALRYYLRWEE